MTKHGRDWSYTTGFLKRAYGAPGVKAVLLSNLAVLAVMLFFNGDVCWLMKVYWWEMAVVWLFSMLKAFTVSPLHAAAWLLPSALSTGFVMLIYMAIAAEAGRCQTMSAALWMNFMQPALLAALAPLVFSHGRSFLYAFWPERAKYGGDGSERNAKDFCFEPMHRVTFWMVVFITCCFVAERAGIKSFAYVLIIGFKAIADALTLSSMSDTEHPPANDTAANV